MKTLLTSFLVFVALLTKAATVTLTWDANTDGVTTSYTVYKVLAGTTSAIGSVTHPTVTLSVTRELPGTTASYYVTAKSSQGLESGPSNVVVDTVPSTLPLPSAIMNLTGTVSVSGGTVTETLTWSANLPSEQVTSYLVTRYNASGAVVQTVSVWQSTVQMTFPQSTMRTDIVAINATGASPIRSFTVTQPRVPWNARLTVTN